jgi:hypothetical protein
LIEFDPVRILRALNDWHVSFVLIGGLAGIAHGSSLATFDLDICALEILGALRDEIEGEAP